MTTPDEGERPRVVGLIAAGGSGERLGADGPKAFTVLAGRPMVEWSHDVLAAVCDRVVVAVPAGHEDDGPDRVVGGPCRSDSVRRALEAAPEATVAVIHDAARPLVTPELVRSCIDGLDGVDGAVAAAPVSDTVKEANGERMVTRTLDRASLWAIQTPQVFRADALRRAVEVDEAVLAAATDDSSLVEAAGGAVRLVEAPRENFKVTTALDLRVAEAILADRC
ncbi:MAG TPA: 2-C-methyl-D-erythritol 4-phosphate cytidylyltransferase [Thermoleophilaceae bacterium]|nr:2-C-methyl-D-erythritol 4-phosphate cytidylyltransferase [Thermoleophilaceae bacterium]